MMDWPTASVAMAASLATGGIAVWTVRQTAANAEADREHDRDLAREARRQDRRETAYLEVLAALNRLMARVERTYPIFVAGTPPEPPPPLGDPELWRLNALIAAHASQDVKAMMREWTQKQTSFYVNVDYLRQVQQDLGPRPSDTRARYGTTSLEQWQKVEAIRQDLRDRTQAIGEKVSEELEG